MKIFIATLIIFIALIWPTSEIEYFVRHPLTKAVTLNSTFTLECRFKTDLFQNPKGDIRPHVHWAKNGFGLGSTREDIQNSGMSKRYKYSRYDLPYNLNEGQYDLQVTNAEVYDEGKYVCQLAYDGKTYLSQTAMVWVRVPSADPVLIQLDPNDQNAMTLLEEGKPATVVEGEMLKLRCIAKDGKPGAQLTWLLNGIPLKLDYTDSAEIGKINNGIEGNISYNSTQDQNYPKLVTARTDIAVYVTKLHHGQQIACKAHNAGYEEFQQKPAITLLNILYPPFVSMKIHSSNEGSQLTENDVITFLCSAEGRPDTFQWRWSVNGSLVPNVKVPQYRLRLIRELYGLPVRCIATTFKSEYREIILSFNYAPRFHQSQNMLYAGSVNEYARMHCAADGNPKPIIEWRRWKSGELLTRGEVLHRYKIQPDDFGTYICTAIVKGFPPISKEIVLAKKTSPSIKPIEPVLATIGSSVRIPCTIYSVPLPARKDLLWNRRGVALRETSHRQFITEEFIGGVVHTLFFKHIMSTDFGFYNCSASNGFGSAWITIELRKDDDLSVNLLAGISSALVIFIVISLGVVFYCRRKQNRMKNIKDELFTTGISAFNKHTESTGNSHRNLIPPAMRNGFKASFSENIKNDGRQSVSDSTEVDSLSRYQYPSNLRRVPLRPQAASSIGGDHYIRSISPICSYALIGDRPIPVCKNMAVTFTDPDDLQLSNKINLSSFTMPESYASPCSDYQHFSVFNASALPVSETYQLSSPSESDATTTVQHLGFVPLATLSADNDIIINTQVTSV